MAIILIHPAFAGNLDAVKALADKTNTVPMISASGRSLRLERPHASHRRIGGLVGGDAA